MYIYLSQKWGDLNFQGQFFKKVYFFVQGMCPMILGTVISQCWESSKDTKCHSEVFPREKKFLAMICHSAAILELYTVGTTLLWPLLVQCCHEFYCENSQALILLTLIPSSVRQFDIPHHFPFIWGMVFTLNLSNARVQLLRTVKQFQLVWCNLKFFISIHDNIGSGLTILETTIGNNNKDNWRFVTAENSVLEGIRATVANRFVKLKIKTVKVSSYVRLAKDGQSWTEIFSKHNSGTYNNQWMVINNNLFTPGVGIMHFNHD